MAVVITEVTVKTTTRAEMVDVTAEVNKAIQQSGTREGLCLVFTLHTTAGVMINEGADPGLAADILGTLTRLIPREGHYQHEDADENADAHIKAGMIGPSQLLIVRDGAPVLGTWQSIFLCEFDGPRERHILIKVIPD